MGFRYGRTVTASVVRTATSGNRVEIIHDDAGQGQGQGQGQGMINFYSGQTLETLPGNLTAAVAAYTDGTPFASTTLSSPGVDGNNRAQVFAMSESVTLDGGGVYGSTVQILSDFVEFIEEDSEIGWQWDQGSVQVQDYGDPARAPQEMVLQPSGGGVRIGAGGTPLRGLDVGTFQGSDTAGNFTVPHGLGVTPSVVLASLDNRLAGGVEKWHVIVGELTSTAFGAHVNDNTGANVSKEVTILWVAIA